MPPQHTLTRRLFLLVAASLAALSLSATAQMAAPQEGNQYLRLKNPQPVESGKKIEVIEFFSYGCPHCGEFEPILQLGNAVAFVIVEFILDNGTALFESVDHLFALGVGNTRVVSS